jgi:hypothetical protein
MQRDDERILLILGHFRGNKQGIWQLIGGRELVRSLLNARIDRAAAATRSASPTRLSGRCGRRGRRLLRSSELSLM